MTKNRSRTDLFSFFMSVMKGNRKIAINFVKKESTKVKFDHKSCFRVKNQSESVKRKIPIMSACPLPEISTIISGFQTYNKTLFELRPRFLSTKIRIAIVNKSRPKKAALNARSEGSNLNKPQKTS